MLTIVLIPDVPCDWHLINKELSAWNPEIQPVTGAAENEAQFHVELPGSDTDSLASLMQLREILRPHAISFSLEYIS
jgi:hypothetical protein